MKEDFLSRAILLMHSQPLVSMVAEMEDSFTIVHPRRRGRVLAVALSESSSASVTSPPKYPPKYPLLYFSRNFVVLSVITSI